MEHQQRDYERAIEGVQLDVRGEVETEDTHGVVRGTVERRLSRGPATQRLCAMLP